MKYFVPVAALGCLVSADMHHNNAGYEEGAAPAPAVTHAEHWVQPSPYYTVEAEGCEACDCSSCVHTETYTKTYEAFCPTGVVEHEYKIVEVYRGMSKPAEHQHTEVPKGFKVSEETCHECGPEPITKTMTYPEDCGPFVPVETGKPHEDQGKHVAPGQHKGEHKPHGEHRPHGEHKPHGEHYPEGEHKPEHHGKHYPEGEHKPEHKGEHYPEGEHKPHGEHYPEGEHKPEHKGEHYPEGEHRPEGEHAQGKHYDQEHKDICEDDYDYEHDDCFEEGHGQEGHGIPAEEKHAEGLQPGQEGYGEEGHGQEGAHEGLQPGQEGYGEQGHGQEGYGEEGHGIPTEEKHAEGLQPGQEGYGEEGAHEGLQPGQEGYGEEGHGEEGYLPGQDMYGEDYCEHPPAANSTDYGHWQDECEHVVVAGASRSGLAALTGSLLVGAVAFAAAL